MKSRVLEGVSKKCGKQESRSGKIHITYRKLFNKYQKFKRAIDIPSNAAQNRINDHSPADY